MTAVDKYLNFLWNCFQFDIQTFSHAWMYYYLLIPAAGYFVFFAVKWMILTTPMWMPIAILMRLANIPSPKCRNCIYKTANEFEFTDKPVDTDIENEKPVGKKGKPRGFRNLTYMFPIKR